MVGDVLAALHEVLERHQVTEQEWMAALAFLTEVGRADEFVLLSDVTRTSVLIDALSHAGDEDGATASDVEGPLYVDDPPVREGSPAKIYDEYEGMGDADVLIVGGRVTSAARRRAAAGGDRRRLADRPRRRLRHLGRAPAGVQLPRQDPPRRRRELRDPDDAPEAVHRADRRARPAATWRRSASTRGGPRTSTSR